MTAALPGLLVVGPIGAAAVVALLPSAAWRRRVATAATAALLVVALTLLAATSEGSRIVLTVGGLPAPLGITVVADVLASIAAVVSVAVVLAVQVALRDTDADAWPLTRAALLLVTAGVLLSFVTADLFTLFVSFEIVLLGSYALLTRDGDRAGTAVAPAYVAANVAASAVFLLSIAGVYGATGHVALAEVAAAWPEVDPLLRTLLGTGLVLVFATKAALVPLGVWLPRTYGALPPVLGAAVGALLTKVGVVALLRVGGLLDLSLLGSRAGEAVLAAAAVTMLVGVVVAIGQTELHRILAAHVVSQVGFMVAGLGLLDIAGTAGGILYLAHHVLVKGALLLVAAAVVARTGSLALPDLRGLMRSAPAIGVLFLIGAATLAGLPPTSGFVAKLALLRAGIDAGAWLVVASMSAASLLTLVSMVKIHTAMRGEPSSSDDPGPSHERAVQVGTPAVPQRALRGALLGAGGLLAAGVALSVLAGPAHELSLVAAEQLLDIDGYVTAVLP